MKTAYDSLKMDWIHCNNCFQLPDSAKNFVLTSCGHIYCCDCEEKCARELCKLCGNQCLTINISSSMKPDVQIYFMDPGELLRKKLKEILQVSEFQKNHRARLMTYQKKQLLRHKQMKEDFRKLLKNLKDLDNERKVLHEQNTAMKNFIGLQHRNRGERKLQSSEYTGTEIDKGRKKISETVSPTSSHANPIFSKFFSKMGNSVPQSAPGRLSVFSPPMHGKMGVIPSPETPSPSSAIRKLNLSSVGSDESRRSRGRFPSPVSSQDSMISKYTAFVTPTASPADAYGLFQADQHKKEARKVVVHPYSLDD